MFGLRITISVIQGSSIRLISNSKQSCLPWLQILPIKPGSHLTIRRDYRVNRDQDFQVKQKAQVICKEFECDLKEVETFLSHSPHITKMGSDKFRCLVKTFTKYKITSKDIFENASVFNRNCDTLKVRFKQLQILGVKDVNLSQVNTTHAAFKRRLTSYKNDKLAKDVYSDVPVMIMSVIGCSRQEAQALMDANRILNSSKLSTLKNKLELLLAQGVAPKIILEKSWILSYPAKRLESRSKTLRKHGITFQKCPKSFFYLMKCSKEAFEKNLQFWKDELKVLEDCDDKVEFLCKLLDCDKKDVAILKRSYSKILSVSAGKMQNTCGFLRACEIPSKDVIPHGRLFSFSTNTIKQRYDELEELGYTPITANSLALDSRAYKKLVERLKLQIA